MENISLDIDLFGTFDEYENFINLEHDKKFTINILSIYNSLSKDLKNKYLELICSNKMNINTTIFLLGNVNRMISLQINLIKSQKNEKILDIHTKEIFDNRTKNNFMY